MVGLLCERVADERGCKIQESDPGTKGVTETGQLSVKVRFLENYNFPNTNQAALRGGSVHQQTTANCQKEPRRSHKLLPQSPRPIPVCLESSSVFIPSCWSPQCRMVYDKERTPAHLCPPILSPHLAAVLPSLPQMDF